MRNAHELDPDNANVDIIAVTGLSGHALGSFRSANGTSVWLRDFAPQDIPRARFITYGYDTAVVVSNNNQGVGELAHTLLDGLVSFRHRTQTQQRPLLFVCHSLGGVVLKEALVMSSKVTEPKHKRMLEVMTMTYGLILIGVPNLGLKHSQLETVVKGRANEGFVRDLLRMNKNEQEAGVKEAVRLLEQVVAIEERVLAEDHPDRLTSQRELARAYLANGQVKDAVRLLEQVVAIRERVLAKDHPDQLASQHELATTYQADGQVKDAMRLLEQVVAIRERVLAEDHPDRLASQAVLASAYQALELTKGAIASDSDNDLFQDCSDTISSSEVKGTSRQALSPKQAQERAVDITLLPTHEGKRESMVRDNARWWQKWKRK
ncbi:hypothetical protein LTR95_014238 [Oleoguttula sp. CCFEE 5521]